MKKYLFIDYGCNVSIKTLDELKELALDRIKEDTLLNRDDEDIITYNLDLMKKLSLNGFYSVNKIKDIFNSYGLDIIDLAQMQDDLTILKRLFPDDLTQINTIINHIEMEIGK